MATTPPIAREALEQALARGNELLRQGQLPEAQQSFRTALALAPGNARVLALLGLAYFRAGQFGEARPIYEELVERAATDASHRLNLGLVFLKLGDADRAIHALEASRALDPSQGRAVSYLGLAYARAGRYAEAYRSFLLAGQTDLAKEIETNLSPEDRAGIDAQLRTDRLATVVATPAAAPAPGAHGATSAPDLGAAALAAAAAAPTAEATPEPLPPPPAAPRAARLSRPNLGAAVAAPSPDESLRFVVPTAAAVPTNPDLEREAATAISRAVALATPSAASAGTGPRAALGATAPRPLSEFATSALVRADDGDAAFELTAGALVLRVHERLFTRLDGIHVTGGDLSFEPATRRSRGSHTDERFDHGGTPLHVVTGRGYLVALPDRRPFTAVQLDDDIFYLREDLVFAFEASLRWENGNVPGLRGRLPIVQFRGDGAVVLRAARPLVPVKLPPQGVLFADAGTLAGWIGRVVPRAVVPPSGGPMAELCVECTGEGVVLIEPRDPQDPPHPGGAVPTA